MTLTVVQKDRDSEITPTRRGWDIMAHNQLEMVLGVHLNG